MEQAMDKLWNLIDHIETEHWRELSPPYTFTRLNSIHEFMHESIGLVHDHESLET